MEKPTSQQLKKRSRFFNKNKKPQLFLMLALGLFLITIAVSLITLINHRPNSEDQNPPMYQLSFLEKIEPVENEQEITNDFKGLEEAKIIYLTFDDGPGPYTNQLLDVLAKYNVKATFFVTGAGDDSILLREYQEGHAIGLHTFSHNYAYVYSSINNFMADLTKIQDRVKNVTGYTSHLMRFPGGSSNAVSKNYDGGTHIMSKLVDLVEKQGFAYFDWNVSSGDAGGATSSEAVANNVIRSLKNVSVVLQHDIKPFSVNAVETIINYGLNNGYIFEKLSETAYTAHHGVTN